MKPLPDFFDKITGRAAIVFCSAPRSFINCILFAPPPFPDVEPCAGSRRARPEHQHRPQREIALIARHRSLAGAIAPDDDPFPDCLIYGIAGDGLADTRLPADESVPSVLRNADKARRRVAAFQPRIDLIAEKDNILIPSSYERTPQLKGITFSE